MSQLQINSKQELDLFDNEIIPVYQITSTGEKVVDGRKLHDYLEVDTRFRTWVKRRIKEYGFEDGLDFSTILSESGGGRPSKEYIFTLDTGKELGMVEKTKKGSKIRKYFIELEKEARGLTQEPKDDLALVENLNKQVGHIVTYIRKQDQEIKEVKNEVQRLGNKVDVEKSHEDVTASEIARRIGVTTVNNTAHNQLIGAIAKKLGMKNNYKHRYQDGDVKILPRAEGGFQVYYKPDAAQKIYEWFNEHKDAIYYEKYYSRGGKYGNKGDLKEKGYTVRGVNYKVWSAKESKQAS